MRRRILGIMAVLSLFLLKSSDNYVYEKIPLKCECFGDFKTSTIDYCREDYISKWVVAGYDLTHPLIKRTIYTHEGEEIDGYVLLRGDLLRNKNPYTNLLGPFYSHMDVWELTTEDGKARYNLKN